ncbi:hypothetical protein BGX38DRAFT_477082 [Terfezia claveryi]|nr:hypothetical protein BGX38DRAFT_477082 [Terfezia claveryi]
MREVRNTHDHIMTGSSVWNWIWIPVILGVCTVVGFAFAVLHLLRRLHIWTWQRPRNIPSNDNDPPTFALTHGPYVGHDEEEAPKDLDLWGTLHYRRDALAASVENRQHNTVGEFPESNTSIALPGKAAWNPSTSGAGGAFKRRPLPDIPGLSPGPSRVQAVREEGANDLRRPRRGPSTPAGEWLSGDRAKGKGKGKERAVSPLEDDVNEEG